MLVIGVISIIVVAVIVVALFRDSLRHWSG